MDVVRPVDSEGRLRLPDEVREELDLEAGDRVTITLEDGEVRLRPGDHTQAGDHQRKGNRSPARTGVPKPSRSGDEQED